MRCRPSACKRCDHIFGNFAFVKPGATLCCDFAQNLRLPRRAEKLAGRRGFALQQIEAPRVALQIVRRPRPNQRPCAGPPERLFGIMNGGSQGLRQIKAAPIGRQTAKSIYRAGQCNRLSRSAARPQTLVRASHRPTTPLARDQNRSMRSPALRQLVSAEQNNRHRCRSSAARISPAKPPRRSPHQRHCRPLAAYQLPPWPPAGATWRTCHCWQKPPTCRAVGNHACGSPHDQRQTVGRGRGLKGTEYLDATIWVGATLTAAPREALCSYRQTCTTPAAGIGENRGDSVTIDLESETIADRIAITVRYLTENSDGYGPSIRL